MMTRTMNETTHITRTVPLLDLKAQYETIRDEVIREVTRVMDSQQFILGPDVRGLEHDMAVYTRSKFAIGCGSGSDALMLALMALDISPGDKVLTTPYTFFATVGAISRLGATPVFADVEADTFNLDPDMVADAAAEHPEIRAVIPVHLFGACANIDPICNIAAENCWAVIEDAAQSIGSEYNGRPAGGIGTFGCFSFFPSKNLGAFGDGGMVTTNDEFFAEKLAALRVHGAKKKYFHEFVGVNSRLDALQAAALRVKLKHLDSWTERRQRNAGLYVQLIHELGIPVIEPAQKSYQTRHIFNQFVIRAARRDELQAFLKKNGIGTEVYYPLPMHLQKCFSDLGYSEGSFPVAERLAKESLALPVYPELAPEDIEYVCLKMREFYREG